MSTYEKIATALIAALTLAVIVLSYGFFEGHETRESKNAPRNETIGYEETVGQDFDIGPFKTTASKNYSGGREDDCEKIRPIIVAALHDIYERLKTKEWTKESGTEWGSFELNDETLDVFCYEKASVVLTDAEGNRLMLEKIPFVRTIPAGGTEEDIGTKVRINATIIKRGVIPPNEPTTFGDVLIPDKFLEAR